MALALETVLGGTFAVCAGLAIAAGSKDAFTRGLCIAAAIVGAVIALCPLVGALHDLLHRVEVALGIAAGVLGAMIPWRHERRVLGGLIAMSGLLLALAALDVVKGWTLY